MRTYSTPQLPRSLSLSSDLVETDFRVIFIDPPPLGLTLIRNNHGGADIAKVKPGGQASNVGVIEGDSLIAINDLLVLNYDDVVISITNASFPLTISFRRSPFRRFLSKSNS